VYVHDPHCRGQRELTRGVCQSAACQRGHWKQHKVHCRENGQWFDKYRAVLEDGSTHFGDLELITGRWTHEYGDEIGWANAFLRDVDELRAKFETTFHGSEEWFFVYRRQAFRWTCCGQDAYTKRGCDHHGPGPKPCSCDFCMYGMPTVCWLLASLRSTSYRMGKPLPPKLYENPEGSAMGLTLSRGPDPRYAVISPYAGSTLTAWLDRTIRSRR
jgi:hypothetical protein